MSEEGKYYKRELDPPRGMPPTEEGYRAMGGKIIEGSELAGHEDDEDPTIEDLYSRATVFDEGANKFVLNARTREELIEAGVDPDSIDMDRDPVSIVEELTSILDPEQTLDLYDQYDGDPHDGDWADE